MRFLLVEDDSSFGYILKEYLEINGFEVIWIQDGEKASRELENSHFDLVILDIMLPGTDGFTLAGEIKDLNPEIPLIFLTAKSLKIDKLKGFRLGADDYITKPVDEEVLIAKINALLKRTRPNGENTGKESFKIGKYIFDWKNQQLIYSDGKQQLTTKEARILKLLCEHENRIMDRKKALQEIWGNTSLFNRKSMDVFIFKLRKYLEMDESIRITNVHGKGFILETGKR